MTDCKARGIVYLLGGGPGDPDLLTLKAKEYLASADTVVYDRLTNLNLLGHAKADAELIYAGKRPGAHRLTQDEINALLVDKASSGRVVARLHGGDPFVFGRGGEEADFLMTHGIPYQVVPGVSSAIAVPAYAGVPLTDRRCASSFAVMSGHACHALPTADTLVVLMGVERLEDISTGLIDSGRSPDTPAIAIQWGTTAGQKSVRSSLADIAAKCRATGLASPAVIVIGEVVKLHERGEWRKVLPLAGKRVLLTRRREQSAGLASDIARLGGEVLVFPTIEAVSFADSGELDVQIARLEEYDWLVFTSANGVRIFIERLIDVLGRDVRALGRTRLAAVGEATSACLRGYGLVADVVAKPQSALGLAQALFRHPEGVAGRRFLLLAAKKANGVLPDALTAHGAIVERAAVYKTTLPSHPFYREVRRHIQEGLERPIDFVVFTSPSTVDNLWEALGPKTAESLCSRARVICIGRTTAARVRDMGLEAAKIAPDDDGCLSKGLIKALARCAGIDG